MKLLVMEELHEGKWILHSSWAMDDFRYLLDQLAGRSEAVRSHRRIRRIDVGEKA